MRKLPLTGLAVCATLILSALAPSQTIANTSLDYPVVLGHFYTQGAPSPSEQGKGYRITDEEDIAFWTEFQRLGGVDTLGYPISGRFFWDGYISQATQRGVLQWHPDGSRVELVNLLDYLGFKGFDARLETEYSIPRIDPSLPGTQSEGDWRKVANERSRLIDGSPGIKKMYHTFSDPERLFGLPTSLLVDRGDYRIMRFQRQVLVEWKTEDLKLQKPLGTKVGEIARSLGLFPAVAVEPKPEMPPAPQPEARASEGVTGDATWYGYAFHGRVMRNGEIYNMYDPTITASTAYPLGAWLRVTRPDTGATITVRVTDTGAFWYPHILDLSWAAFSRLANPAEGRILVVVERIS